MKIPEDLSELGGIFIGLDPALKSDYYAAAVNIVNLDRPKPAHPAELVYLEKLRGDSFVSVNQRVDSIIGEFENFTALTIDYTNNQSIADTYADRFGDDRVVKVRFSPGISGTKMQMMQQFSHALDTGYELPDLTIVTDPIFKADIVELRAQALREVIKRNPSGSVSFAHKGPHNDLFHAELLSMYSAQTWIDSYGGSDGSHVGGPMGYAYPDDAMRDLFKNALGGSY